jgi:2-oxoglutarate ferredoxin oxidoreductase subunit gamma
MLAGQILGHAAAYAGKYATYYPSYGPEQRGGTANCTVIISGEEIGSPVVNQADAVIVMNEPSLGRFEPEVKPGGVILVNSSLVKREARREDIRAVYIPASEIAEKLGSAKSANMVMVGAFIAVTRALDPEEVERTIGEKLTGKPGFLEVNKRAFFAGLDEAHRLLAVN